MPRDYRTTEDNPTADELQRSEAGTAAARAKATPKEKVPTVEDHAKAASTPDWAFAAAKAHEKWAIGAELTREAYDAAVKKVLGGRIG